VDWVVIFPNLMAFLNTHREAFQNTSNVELASAWAVPTEIVFDRVILWFGLTGRGGVEMFKVHVNLTLLHSSGALVGWHFEREEKN